MVGADKVALLAYLRVNGIGSGTSETVETPTP